jgi:ankyrin repeat protein
LHFASENDNIDLLKLFIEFGAEINVRNNRNQTVLHFALKNNLHKNFIFLHDSFPTHFDLSHDKDFYNQTYLHYACKQELVLAVNYLIFNNANLNALDNDFRSPIFYAVERGNLFL